MERRLCKVVIINHDKEDTVLDLIELTGKYVWRTLHRRVKSRNQKGSIDQTLMNERKLSGWSAGEQCGVVVAGAVEPESWGHRLWFRN